MAARRTRVPIVAVFNDAADFLPLFPQQGLRDVARVLRMEEVGDPFGAKVLTFQDIGRQRCQHGAALREFALAGSAFRPRLLALAHGNLVAQLLYGLVALLEALLRGSADGQERLDEQRPFAIRNDR